MAITNTIAQLKGIIDTWIEERVIKHEDERHKTNELDDIRLDINDLKSQLLNIEELTNRKVDAALLEGHPASDFVLSAPNVTGYGPELSGAITVSKQGNIAIIQFNDVSQRIEISQKYNDNVKNNSWINIGIKLPEDFQPIKTIYTSSVHSSDEISITEDGSLRVFIKNLDDKNSFNNVTGTLVYTVKSNLIETTLKGITSQDILNNFITGDNYYVKLTDNKGNPISDANVTINWKGKNYPTYGVNWVVTTDENGVAFLKINLNEGAYTITSTFYGNGKYKKTSLVEKITVHKTSKITTIYNNTTDINTITFNNEHGSTIGYNNCVVNINGIKNTKFIPPLGLLNINLSNYKGDVNVSATLEKDDVRINTTKRASWIYKTGRK